jgi:DNA polymerase III alpha subunit
MTFVPTNSNSMQPKYFKSTGHAPGKGAAPGSVEVPAHASVITTAYSEAASMSVFCKGHPISALRPLLAPHGVVSARDLRHIPSGRIVRVSGILVIVHTPPTRSGKRVMFVTMEDETGLMDLVAFPKAQADHARAILTSEVLTVDGRLQRQGNRGLSVSLVIEEVVVSLSGLLSTFLSEEPAAGKNGKRQ